MKVTVSFKLGDVDLARDERLALASKVIGCWCRLGVVLRGNFQGGHPRGMEVASAANGLLCLELLHRLIFVGFHNLWENWTCGNA
eukprot:scaffold76841_cov21-Tisochrysis_lutea.AAC.1